MVFCGLLCWLNIHEVALSKTGMWETRSAILRLVSKLQTSNFKRTTFQLTQQPVIKEHGIRGSKREIKAISLNQNYICNTTANQRLLNATKSQNSQDWQG
jgi:hypothetical protein